MSSSDNAFALPITPFQRVGDQTFLMQVSSAAANPGGSQQSWKTPPSSCFLLPLGQEIGRRWRGADLSFFSDGTSAISIDEIGVATHLMGKDGTPLDAANYQGLFQDVALTIGSMQMGSTQKADLGLSSSTIKFAHTVAIGTKLGLWTNAFQVEGGRDVIQHSPGSNLEARLRIPFLCDESALYLFCGNGGIGVGTALGVLARPYGGR